MGHGQGAIRDPVRRALPGRLSHRCSTHGPYTEILTVPAAAIYNLIETAKLNGIDPQAWLADMLARLPDHPAKRVNDLLPWNWKAASDIS
jgi:hypothetical protein